jgi:ABC-type antimicrobial peptide transport system permease subunit
MMVLWWSPLFWLIGIGFSLFTGLVAGSYPALYLSSFKPVSILKGTFKAGRFASVPRKVLVTIQFTVSVVLIIGTIVVFRQIQYARSRPVGYNRNSLIEVNINTPALKGKYETLRNDLLNTGAVTAFSESSCSITGENGGTTNLNWKGKDPNNHPLVMANHVTPEFGAAVGWKMIQGRDFSRALATDSTSMIMNEAAVKLMGLKDPIGQTVYRGQLPLTVIGVVKNMIRNTPFRPVSPAFYVVAPTMLTTMQVRLAPKLSTRAALAKVATVFSKYNPESPFDFQFVDTDYSRKFGNEERIGGLAGFFAVLAVFISCLGLFGLASFVAEQRTKEIGVRKVLGASVFNVWRLLSKEFALLVVLSLLIAMPVGYYFMHKWLLNYDYRAPLSWWIFAATGCGALLITLLTVSFQAVKAGLANPVKSLRTE